MESSRAPQTSADSVCLLAPGKRRVLAKEDVPAAVEIRSGDDPFLDGHTLTGCVNWA